MMVNVKKNKLILGYFVILLTFFSLISCKTTNYLNYKVEGKKIGITSEKGENKEIEAYIAPFRANITKELDSVLAYCPETLDKSKGKWQTAIGNLLAAITILSFLELPLPVANFFIVPTGTPQKSIAFSSQ